MASKQRNTVPSRMPSRRAALGAVGVLAAGAATAGGAAMANASESSSSTGAASADRIPRALRPGGEFDEFVAEQAARDAFSGVVLLRHRNRNVLTRTYGLANKEQDVAIEVDTVFDLGSITKLFTATAIARLAQQGEVLYHERLAAYLPDFPARISDQVTVQQLLTHTSGLGDHMRQEGYFDEMASWNSAEEVIQGNLDFVAREELRFSPGSAHEYSNAGYHLLGAVVAAVSGQSYHDYVREQIFRSIGMRRADFYTAPQRRRNAWIARPYTRQGSAGGWVDGIDRHSYIGDPAGGALATAADLVRFQEALTGGEFLSPTFTELVLTPKFANEPLPAKPGLPQLLPFASFAPAIHILRDQRIVGHNGGAPGVDTNLWWYPDSGWTTVLLCNYDARTSEPTVQKLTELITTNP